MGFGLAIVTGIGWLYVVLRCIRLLPAPKGWRIALAVVLLAVAEYEQVTGRFFGTLASPELPRGVLFALAWAFGTFVLLVLLLVVRDVIGLVMLAFVRHAGRWVLRSGALAAGVGIAAMVLAGVGVWNGVKVPRVKQVAISVQGLPATFDGYRIVQLSDLHASRLLPGSWIAAVVRKVDALHPSLIVITGDLEDGTPALRARDVAPLRDLRAPDGVLAVPGNHEYYADYAGWMKAFRKLGLHMLLNAHVVIRRGGAALAVAGITDKQAAAFGDPVPDLAAAMAGIAPGVPVILLSHHPGNARASARAGVALELAGHTHGGQIRGPDLITRWANHGFLSGLYRVGAMQLYVSNGTGLWNGLALRLGRPSEITEITLRSGAQ